MGWRQGASKLQQAMKQTLTLDEVEFRTRIFMPVKGHNKKGVVNLDARSLAIQTSSRRCKTLIRCNTYSSWSGCFQRTAATSKGFASSGLVRLAQAVGEKGRSNPFYSRTTLSQLCHACKLTTANLRACVLKPASQTAESSVQVAKCKFLCTNLKYQWLNVPELHHEYQIAAEQQEAHVEPDSHIAGRALRVRGRAHQILEHAVICAGATSAPLGLAKRRDAVLLEPIAEQGRNGFH